MLKPTNDSGLALAALVMAFSSLLPGSAALAETAGINFVRLDMDEAYLPEIDQSIWVIQTSSDELPLALSAPAGPGGLQIPTVSALTPPLGAGFFAEGTTSTSVLESVASMPFVEFMPGWLARGGYFAINFTSLPPGVEMTDPTIAQVVQVVETPAPRGYTVCGLCIAVETLCIAVYGTPGLCDPDCKIQERALPGSVRALGEIRSRNAPRAESVPRPRGDLDFSWMGVLRRYRDEVLAGSTEGQFYAEFYTDHSADLARALFASPTLLVRTYRVATAWAPAFQALVDGTGDSFTISQTMEDDLLALFDTFESVGAPAFSQAIAFERTRLQLDGIAGLTMTEYQTQIETLGGSTAVEPTSWGRVKALYR